MTKYTPAKKATNKLAKRPSINNFRTAIPPGVKYQLWVAAGGRCEFSGCNERLDKNIITQQRILLSEHAHIIGDSIHGPRGDVRLSKKLGKDIGNIILVCKKCHTTIDKLEDNYPVDLLREMKRHHEDRIARFFDIDFTKVSLPIILKHPIKQLHVPRFSIEDVQASILRNSTFSRFPSEELILIDFSRAPIRDEDPASWGEVAKNMKEKLLGEFRIIETRIRIEHISVFAFAPMPLLMQLGFLLGNKNQILINQWDRVAEDWAFKGERQFDRQEFEFEQIPPSGGRELAVAFSLSAEVDTSAISIAVPGIPLVQFRVPSPTPFLVEDVTDIQHFRTSFNDFMAKVRKEGYTRIHLFPAMPISLCVELGRQLMPKAGPTALVWDYQDSSHFVRTIELSL